MEKVPKTAMSTKWPGCEQFELESKSPLGTLSSSLSNYFAKISIFRSRRKMAESWTLNATGQTRPRKIPMASKSVSNDSFTCVEIHRLNIHSNERCSSSFRFVEHRRWTSLSSLVGIRILLLATHSLLDSPAKMIAPREDRCWPSGDPPNNGTLLRCNYDKFLKFTIWRAVVSSVQQPDAIARWKFKI